MSDFDLTQEYQEKKSKDHQYTVKKLSEDLLEVYVSTKSKSRKKSSSQGIKRHDIESHLADVIRRHCAEIFPSCQNINLAKMKSAEKYQYLKFFYYIGKTYSEWRKDGYNLFDCLRNPSERHRTYYVKMLEEILANKDKISLASQVAREIQGNDGQGYADSLHMVHYWINSIAFWCHTEYEAEYDKVEEDWHEFCQILDDYNEKSAQLERSFENDLSCWDELCLLLAHNRDLYWEISLLRAHKMVYHITKQSMLRDETRLLMFPDPQFHQNTDDYQLVYRNGKIEEIFPHNGSEDEDDKFLDALEEYVKDHIDELTTKIFSKSPPKDYDKTRVINHFSYFRGYWEMERQLYEQNCKLTKIKLISAYQVIFMTLPSSGITFSKFGFPMKRENGRLYRESKSLSSSYKNPSGMAENFV